MLLFAVHCRPPPAPPVGAEVAGNDRAAVEVPAIVEQPPASNDAATAATDSGLPTIDVQTNPELPSPARVRWMDAFSRVCAHLNQVRQTTHRRRRPLWNSERHCSDTVRDVRSVVK